MGRRAGQECEVGVGDDRHQRLEGMATVSIILEGSWVAGSWSRRAAPVTDNKGQWTRSMAAIGDRHYHLGGTGDTAAATRCVWALCHQHSNSIRGRTVSIILGGYASAGRQDGRAAPAPDNKDRRPRSMAVIYDRHHRLGGTVDAGMRRRTDFVAPQWRRGGRGRYETPSAANRIRQRQYRRRSRRPRSMNVIAARRVGDTGTRPREAGTPNGICWGQGRRATSSVTNGVWQRSRS